MCRNFFALVPEIFISKSENDRKSLICSQRYFSSKRSPRHVESNSDNPPKLFFQETDFFLVKQKNYLKN